MRYFAHALVLIVGFSAAVLAARAEQSRPAIQNCYDVAADSGPTICE